MLAEPYSQEMGRRDLIGPISTIIVFCMTLYLCAQTRWQVAQNYMRWSDELFSILCLLTMLVWAYRRQGKAPVPLFLVLTFALYCIAATAHFIAYSNIAGPSALVDLASLLFAMTLFPLLIGWLCSQETRTVEWLLFAWLVGATVSALVADLGRHGMSFFGIYRDYRAASGRTFGLTFHPNSIGYISTLTTPVAIYFMLTSKRIIAVSAAFLAAIALQYAVMGSGSRTSLVAGIAGLLPFAFYVFRGRLNRLHITGLIALILVIVLGAASYSNKRDVSLDEASALARISGTASAERANENRLARLRVALEDSAESPVYGKGYGALTFAHNLFLQNLHSGGVVALVSFLIFIGGFLYCWIAVYRHQQRVRVPEREQVLLWTIASSCLIWFLSGLTHNYIADRNSYVMFGVLLGLWFYYKNQTSTDEHNN